MKKRTSAIIFGVLFGLGMIAYAYFSFIIAIVVSLKFEIDLTPAIFAFPVLGIATIIGACLIKKSVLVTRIIYCISTLFYIASQIFLFSIGLFSEFSLTMLLFILLMIIGILATIFAFLTKTQQSINPTEIEQ